MPSFSGVIGACGRVRASSVEQLGGALEVAGGAPRVGRERRAAALSSSSFWARTTGVAASRARWRVRS